MDKSLGLLSPNKSNLAKIQLLLVITQLLVAMYSSSTNHPIHYSKSSVGQITKCFISHKQKLERTNHSSHLLTQTIVQQISHLIIKASNSFPTQRTAAVFTCDDLNGASLTHIPMPTRIQLYKICLL